MRKPNFKTRIQSILHKTPIAFLAVGFGILYLLIMLGIAVPTAICFLSDVEVPTQL